MNFPWISHWNSLRTAGARALGAPRAAAALRRAAARRGALRARGERGAAGEGDAGRTGRGDPPGIAMGHGSAMEMCKWEGSINGWFNEIYWDLPSGELL